MPAANPTRTRLPGLDAEIVVADERWRGVAGLRRIATLAKAANMVLSGAATGREVVIALGSDAEARALNRTYRGKDQATNVLSFAAAGQAKATQLGDVILAYETCAREAEEHGIALSDHACHLALHGVLHLLGCDHEVEADAEVMEALETRVLAMLGIADPHAAELATE